MRGILLEDFAFPICEYEVRDGAAWLIRLIGSGFFINGEGVYLTARHVIEQCEADPSKLHGVVLRQMDNDGRGKVIPLLRYEHAPRPFDVTIGSAELPTASMFHYDPRVEADSWRDVQVLGYPESALNITPDRFGAPLRALKGYVTRPLKPGDLPEPYITPHAFELSFQISAGMSGSPLFTTPSNMHHNLLGVCVSSFSSEVVEYLFEEVEESGAVFREKRVRAEQFGIAHDIRYLDEWRPSILQGRSLSEVIRCTDHDGSV